MTSLLFVRMSDKFLAKYGEEFHCINLQMSRGTNPIEMLKSIVAFYKIFQRERFDYIQYATPNASLYASVAAYLAKCLLEFTVSGEFGMLALKE